MFSNSFCSLKLSFLLELVFLVCFSSVGLAGSLFLVFLFCACWSLYSVKEPIKSLIFPSPSKTNKWSTILSIKYLSCETMIRQPWNCAKKLSSTVSVGRSKSLVGSSKMRKFGFWKSTEIRYSLLLSPPLRLEMVVYCVCSLKRNIFKNCDAEILFPFARG